MPASDFFPEFSHVMLSKQGLYSKLHLQGCICDLLHGAEAASSWRVSPVPGVGTTTMSWKSNKLFCVEEASASKNKEGTSGIPLSRCPNVWLHNKTGIHTGSAAVVACGFVDNAWDYHVEYLEICPKHPLLLLVAIHIYIFLIMNYYEGSRYCASEVKCR